MGGTPDPVLRSSLRGLAITVAVATPVLLLLAVLVAHVLEQQQRSTFETRATGEARSVLLALPDDLAGPASDDLSRALRRPAQLELVILDTEGRESRSSDTVDLIGVPADVRRWSADQPLRRWVSVGGDSILVVGGAKRDGGPALVLYFSDQSLVYDRERSRLLLAVATGILLILIAFAGWALSYRRLRSITMSQNRERAFTAHVAHELRTPVGALVAAASFIDERALRGCTDAVREPVVLMQTEARRLRHIVENLLELSRLEAGHVDTQLEILDVAQIVRTTIASYGWTDVRLEVDGTVQALTDRHSLARVLLNLISNAIRHARNEVVVTVRGEEDDVILEVADDGPGMPPARVRQLLTDRRLGATSADPDETGRGLGLLITLAHAKLIRAQIEVDSASDIGTTVRVRLAAVQHQRLRAALVSR